MRRLLGSRFLRWAVAVLLSAGVLLLLPHAAAAAPVVALFQTGPTPTQQLLYDLFQVVVAAGAGLIATEWSKIFTFVQNLGTFGVLLVSAVWGAVAGFVSPILHVVIPTDINQVTGATIGAILTAVVGLLLHVNQTAVQTRRATLGARFRF